MTTLKEPVAINHWSIRSARFEASVIGTKPGRGDRQFELHMGRFITADDARVWADAIHADAQRVHITFFTKTDGWKGRLVDVRDGGRWKSSDLDRYGVTR